MVQVSGKYTGESKGLAVEFKEVSEEKLCGKKTQRQFASNAYMEMRNNYDGRDQVKVSEKPV